MRRAACVVVAALSLLASASGVAAQVPGVVATSLGDPTLERLLGLAMEGNPDLAAVRARMRGARAQRFQSALDLAPTVTAIGGYTRQRISGASFPGLTGTLPDQDVWEAGVQLSWEVDVFGRVRRSFDARSAMLDAAEEGVDDAAVLLGAEVASTYFGLRGAQDRLEVARRNADNQRRTLTVTQDRLDAGRGTALDTERARAQLSSTLSAIPTLEATVAALENRLAVLVGRDPDAPLEELASPWSFPELPASVAVGEVQSVVRARPDVLAAAHVLSAQESLVSAAKADLLPRISIRGAAGYTASAFDALGNTGTPRYAIGPVISWPLLDLARAKSNVDGAVAARVEAQAHYQGTQLRAEEEIRTSVLDYAQARVRLAHLREAAAASDRAAELARLRFDEGAGDFLEVLDAERRLLEAEDRMAAGRTDALTALVAAYRAVGASWTRQQARR